MPDRVGHALEAAVLACLRRLPRAEHGAHRRLELAQPGPAGRASPVSSRKRSRWARVRSARARASEVAGTRPHRLSSATRAAACSNGSGGQPGDDVGERLDEAPVAVPGQARVAGHRHSPLTVASQRPTSRTVSSMPGIDTGARAHRQQQRAARAHRAAGRCGTRAGATAPGSSSRRRAVIPAGQLADATRPCRAPPPRAPSAPRGPCARDRAPLRRSPAGRDLAVPVAEHVDGLVQVRGARAPRRPPPRRRSRPARRGLGANDPAEHLLAQPPRDCISESAASSSPRVASTSTNSSPAASTSADQSGVRPTAGSRRSRARGPRRDEPPRERRPCPRAARPAARRARAGRHAGTSRAAVEHRGGELAHARPDAAGGPSLLQQAEVVGGLLEAVGDVVGRPRPARGTGLGPRRGQRRRGPG